MTVPSVQQEQRSLIFTLSLSEAFENNELFYVENRDLKIIYHPYFFPQHILILMGSFH